MLKLLFIWSSMLTLIPSFSVACKSSLPPFSSTDSCSKLTSSLIFIFSIFIFSNASKKSIKNISFPGLAKNALYIISFFRLYFLFFIVILIQYFPPFDYIIFLIFFAIFFNIILNLFWWLWFNYFWLIYFNFSEKIFMWLLYDENGLTSRKIVRQNLT